jgi:Lanthionine synthetase C-like protein
MSAPRLFAPARHVPLTGDPWSEARARAALAGIVADIEGAYGGEEELWPNHPNDLDDDPDLPFRTVYMGAAGVVWALARLVADGHAAPRLDLAAIAAGLYDRWLAAPEFESMYPAPHPSLLMGSAGMLLLADRLAPDPARHDLLAAAIAANECNPTRELLWGSPGTMLAAQAMAERDGAERWTTLWRASAGWLLGEWRDEVWEQDMYGTRQHYIGPGHGFAGNVHALLRGRSLLAPEVAAEVERRAAAVIEALAVHDGPRVQWPAVLGEVLPSEKTRTQWCHGAPGIVIALGALLRPTPTLDALFAGGGEMTWQAGPLRASSSLCHGTAGNGYAFLRLFERTGDEAWLVRARAFAMHAIGQVEQARGAIGRGRYTLFTGDAGVALYLAACLAGNASFPVLDD